MAHRFSHFDLTLMQLSARSPLTAAAAAVLTAGVVTASPGLGPAGAPRIVSTPVTLLFTAGYHAYIGAYLLDPVHSFTYTPNGSGPSVSHPVGLIPELLGDSRKPPILGALVSGHVHTIQDIPVNGEASRTCGAGNSANVPTFQGQVA